MNIVVGCTVYTSYVYARLFFDLGNVYTRWFNTRTYVILVRTGDAS